MPLNMEDRNCQQNAQFLLLNIHSCISDLFFLFFLLVYLTGRVHINNISENMPELVRKAHFHL